MTDFEFDEKRSLGENLRVLTNRNRSELTQKKIQFEIDLVKKIKQECIDSAKNGDTLVYIDVKIPEKIWEDILEVKQIIDRFCSTNELWLCDWYVVSDFIYPVGINFSLSWYPV